MIPRISLWLALVVTVAGLGCALTAEQPPTPAQYLDGRELAAIPVPPDERFYLLVFSSQSVPKQAKYTHSWATVVRVRHPTSGGQGGCQECDGGGTPEILAVDTISWMPADLEIDPLKFEVEPGVNLNLDQSLQHAVDTDQRITLWGGAFEIWHGLYHRFQVQKAFMESGQVGYQCIDSFGEARDGSGCGCIHAITDMDPRYDRGRYPLAFYGDAASRNILREIMHAPVIIKPRTTHNWLIPALGLDQWPVRQRRSFTLIREDYEPGDAGLDGIRSLGPVPAARSLIPDSALLPVGPTGGTSDPPATALTAGEPPDPDLNADRETSPTANPDTFEVSK